MGNTLQFATGLDEEPLLGFEFVSAAEELKWSFVPTENTCRKTMFLIRGSHGLNLPAEEDFYDVFDTAFSNNYLDLHKATEFYIYN